MQLEAYEIIERLGEDKFAAIFNGLTRKMRTMLESMFVKKRKGRLVSLKSRKKDRPQAAKKVWLGLQDESGNQYADEILRAYFFERRELLKTALDFFEIPNEDGITNQELTALEQADAETLRTLFDALVSKEFDPLDIALYLVFLKTEHAFDLAEVREFFER